MTECGQVGVTVQGPMGVTVRGQVGETVQGLALRRGAGKGWQTEDIVHHLRHAVDHIIVGVVNSGIVNRGVVNSRRGIVNRGVPVVNPVAEVVVEDGVEKLGGGEGGHHLLHPHLLLALLLLLKKRWHLKGIIKYLNV